MVLSWLVLWLLVPDSELHDLHLSKAQVHYNVQSESFEVSMHIFIDDLELAMQEANLENPRIATNREHEKADSLIHVYLDKHFSVVADGKKVNFEFLGKEDSDDLLAIWCYLEGTQIPKPDQLSIANRILVDLYDDQKNILAFTSDFRKEFFMFDDKKTELTIDL